LSPSTTSAARQSKDQGEQRRDQEGAAVEPHLRRQMPKAAEPWSLTRLWEKLIEIGARVVTLGRYVMWANQRVSALRRSQLTGSTACRARDLPLPKPYKRRSCVHNHPESGEDSLRSGRPGPIIRRIPICR